MTKVQFKERKSSVDVHAGQKMLAEADSQDRHEGIGWGKVASVSEEIDDTPLAGASLDAPATSLQKGATASCMITDT